MSEKVSNKILFKRLLDSVYDRRIYVAVGSAEECVPKINKKFGLTLDVSDFEGDSGQHIEVGNEDDKVVDSFVIWLENAKDLAVISHEVFHAAHRIMKYVGIKLSDDSEEAYAYFIESIVRQIVQAVKND